MKNNKSQKGIVVLLSFIAVCMVCIIVLLVSNIFTKSITDTNNTVAESSSVSEDVETVNSDATEPSTSKAEEFYKYEGKLSDTPLKPEEITEIENEDILDYFNDDKIVARYKDEILKYVRDYAKEWVVYGNPTIIPGCEPEFNSDTILVDIHATDGRIINFSLNEDENEMEVRVSYLEEDHYPIVYDGLYILNSSIVHTFLMEYTGATEEEANEQELEMLKLIKKTFDEEGYTDEISDAPYIYLQYWYTLEDEKGTIDFKFFEYTCSSVSQERRAEIPIVSDAGLSNGDYQVKIPHLYELSKEN